MGLKIMRYRARILGGEVRFERGRAARHAHRVRMPAGTAGTTRVRCAAHRRPQPARATAAALERQRER